VPPWPFLGCLLYSLKPAGYGLEESIELFLAPSATSSESYRSIIWPLLLQLRACTEIMSVAHVQKYVAEKSVKAREAMKHVDRRENKCLCKCWQLAAACSLSAGYVAAKRKKTCLAAEE